MAHFGMLGRMILLAIAKRLGCVRPVLRLVVRGMFSEKLKRQAFEDYLPDEHDVFIATFAKSGTNWMMQIAQQIAWRGRAEFDHIHDVVPWPDAPGPMGVALRDTTAREAAPTGLRVIKTHLATEYVPYDERATYVTVIRDPKEVVVSGYYFLGGILGVLGHITIDDWFELFMEPDALARNWAVHTASFWAWRDRPNVVVLSYGELKREPGRWIERVAGAMGVKLSQEELAQVVERASFTWMKEHESQFDPPSSPFATSGAKKGSMIRSGRTGGSDELLSLAQQAAIDRRCQVELAQLDSSFPYAEVFDTVSDPDRRDFLPLPLSDARAATSPAS
jgi:hypothetical protein